MTFGAAGVDLGLVKPARLENGEAISADLAAGDGLLDGKVNPLKASVRPPRFDDDWAAGEARSLTDEVRSCCAGAGGGFAYRDRMDCLRSGRDMPLAPIWLGVVLAGRTGPVG